MIYLIRALGYLIILIGYIWYQFIYILVYLKPDKEVTIREGLIMINLIKEKELADTDDD